MFILRMRLHAKFLYLRYRYWHWLFQWKQDDEGDIAFVICNCLSFVKYKEHTIINLKGASYNPAGKWQGHEDPLGFNS